MDKFPVIISYCNSGYYDFAKNMLVSLNNTIRFHKVHFYCLDCEIYEKLKELVLPNIDVTFEIWKLPNSISKSFESYGSQKYNEITHTKMDILRNALAKYDLIHFIDCDVVCIKEPSLAHYNRYAQYDIIFQHDAGMYSADKLHAPTLHHIWCCTGNTTFRNTPATISILNMITRYQLTYPNKNDQECLYQFFLDISLKDLRDYSGAKLFTYEIREYTNGYWLANDIGSLDDTYFFHANHVSGSMKKTSLLKKAKQYFV